MASSYTKQRCRSIFLDDYQLGNLIPSNGELPASAQAGHIHSGQISSGMNSIMPLFGSRSWGIKGVSLKNQSGCPF